MKTAGHASDSHASWRNVQPDQHSSRAVISYLGFLLVLVFGCVCVCFNLSLKLGNNCHVFIYPYKGFLHFVLILKRDSVQQSRVLMAYGETMG